MPWYRRGINRWITALCVVAAALLLADHFTHLFGFLPYLLLLACPLMHFMHHGHHHAPPTPPERPSPSP